MKEHQRHWKGCDTTLATSKTCTKPFVFCPNLIVRLAYPSSYEWHRPELQFQLSQYRQTAPSTWRLTTCGCPKSYCGQWAPGCICGHPLGPVASSPGLAPAPPRRTPSWWSPRAAFPPSPPSTLVSPHPRFAAMSSQGPPQHFWFCNKPFPESSRRPLKGCAPSHLHQRCRHLGWSDWRAQRCCSLFCTLSGCSCKRMHSQ